VHVELRRGHTYTLLTLSSPPILRFLSTVTREMPLARQSIIQASIGRHVPAMLMAFKREQEPAPYGMEGFVAQYICSKSDPPMQRG
jgi:hypothetical protein